MRREEDRQPLINQWVQVSFFFFLGTVRYVGQAYQIINAGELFAQGTAGGQSYHHFLAKKGQFFSGELGG